MIAQPHRGRAAALASLTLVLFCVVLLATGCSTESGSPTAQSVADTSAAITQPAPDTSSPTTQSPAELSVDDIQVQFIYTSELITLLYPLYGSKLDDFVMVALENTGELPAKVVVASEIVGYTNQATDTVEVAAGETVEVRQNPLLIPEVIDDLNTQKPAQVHVYVSALHEGVEKIILDETAETTVYARREFPWSISGFSQTEVLSFLAAMVTPNDPSVEALIRKAADYTDSGDMWAGYSEEADDADGEVWDRLQAIWQAEQDYDLAYVNTDVSFAPGVVQRVRLPAEVLDQQSGNCIELALLYASAAEAVDLEAALILIPGHMFMSVRTDQENANYYFIETTMIRDATFSEAVEKASQEFAEALPHISAGEEWHGWLRIWDAREEGVFPLPWN